MVTKDESWLESSDVVSMFPTLVWSFQLSPGHVESINASIRTSLNELRRGLPPVVAGHAWQSTPELHELDSFQDLIAQLHRGTRSVLEFLKIGSPAFEVTGCWANINATGASHGIHNHPNTT